MISIVQQPPEVAPVYSDIVMTVVSDKIISKFKNKYVFDIFGSKQLGTLTPSSPIYLGRVKSTPNPSGYGMLDLSRYLQTILGPEMDNTPDTEPKNVQPVSEIVRTTSGTYYIVCGEEYSDTINGPVTLYNGNGTVSSGTTLTSTVSQIMFMFNGVNQFAEGLVFDATDYFQPTGRRLLTNSPRTLYKETDEYISLAAFCGYYSGSTTQANYNIPLRASVYNSAGSLLTLYTGTTPTFTTPNSVNKSIKISTQNLELITSGFTSTWNKIDILLGTLTGATSGTTETITVYRKDCPWQKYDPVDIMFLNRLGGWDFFRFFGSKDEDIKIERGTYDRQYGTWSSINFSYNTNERGTSNIKTDLTLQGEVMSDFLDQDTVNWLEELLTSPEVFIVGEEFTVSALQYRKLIPISVTDSNFKRQVRGNRKLRQVSFKYEYANQIRTQQLGR